MALSIRLLITSSILISQIGWTDYALENFCPVENPMSFQQKRHILRDHNFYRSHIAQGVGIHPEPNKLPGGSNIYRLKWNCRLERLASAAVRGCLPEPTANQLYGQNYAFLKDLSSAGFESLFDTARDTWISSWCIDSTVINNNAVVFNGKAQAQSFANIIRGNTTSVGCSQKQCGQFMAVACLYNSANIENGTTIYELGEQCKNDSDCSAHENSNCDEQGLCVVQQESQEVEDGYSFYSGNKHSSRRLIRITSEKRIVKKLNELKSNKMCSVNTTMADELRSMVLRLHNYRRSSLAKGLVKRIHGNPLPSATNIMKLKYNCALEELAHTRAAQCLLTGNYSEEENGENTASIHQEDAVTFAGAIRWVT
ncbi:unnamed protein product [Cylicocyclus nassatus]|uniref:SCP domain-containing protein n=1 Tax=Cylicocyclus nassatus TaxID=53992 RepID=A0AA36GZF6_CYLNA|nr:unnamed protein product [Cylicocyclus nassatus]